LFQGPGIAWFPGRGNALKLRDTLGDDFATLTREERAFRLAAHSERTARGLLARYAGLLDVAPHELQLDGRWSGSLDDADEMHLTTFRHAPEGVEQHDGRLTFVIAQGNLIQIHVERLQTQRVDPRPTLTQQDVLSR